MPFALYILPRVVVDTAWISYSTLWGHLARTLRIKPETMSSNTQYTKEEDGMVSILEDGFITNENISKMKFTFSKPEDITERLKNSNRPQLTERPQGRTGNANMTCTYPDGKSVSSKILLTNCIVQYRKEPLERGDRYGNTFVNIGIPTIYISKLMADAKKNSGITLRVKDKVKLINNHYWFDCNLDKLTQQNTWIIYEDASGGTSGGQAILKDTLVSMKSNIIVDIMVTVSASMTSKSVAEELDLINGIFYFSIKPTEMFMKSETDIEGPVLEQLNMSQKETTDKTVKFLASAKLAEYAMRNLVSA